MIQIQTHLREIAATSAHIILKRLPVQQFWKLIWKPCHVFHYNAPLVSVICQKPENSWSLNGFIPTWNNKRVIAVWRTWALVICWLFCLILLWFGWFFVVVVVALGSSQNANSNMADDFLRIKTPITNQGWMYSTPVDPSLPQRWEPAAGFLPTFSSKSSWRLIHCGWCWRDFASALPFGAIFGQSSFVSFVSIHVKFPRLLFLSEMDANNNKMAAVRLPSSASRGHFSYSLFSNSVHWIGSKFDVFNLSCLMRFWSQFASGNSKLKRLELKLIGGDGSFKVRGGFKVASASLLFLSLQNDIGDVSIMQHSTGRRIEPSPEHSRLNLLGHKLIGVYFQENAIQGHTCVLPRKSVTSAGGELISFCRILPVVC